MKRKTKNIISILGVLILAAVLISACEKDKQDTLESFGSGPIETTLSGTSSSEEEAFIDAGTESVEAETPSEAETTQPETKPETEKENIIEIDGKDTLPYAVLDNEDYNVVLQDIVKEETGEMYMTFAVNNQHPEYDILIESEYIADGGFLTQGSVGEYITFGSETEVYAQVTDGTDEAADAPHTRITLPLKVTQLTPDEDIVLFDCLLEIYPDGKENAKEYIPEITDVTTVVDGNGCKVVLCGFERSEYYGGWVMKFYCENNTDNTLLFRNTEATVNGNAALDPHWGMIVAPGFRGFGEAVWLDIEAAVAGIEDISEASLHVQALNIDVEDAPEIAAGDVSAKIK